MKRIFLLCIVIMLLCCSCGLFSPQRYVCDAQEVSSIQIVRIGEITVGEFDYTVLSQISDHETFVKCLNEVDHSVNWGDPYPMDVGFIAIRIEYMNGDCDYINSDAQWFVKSESIKTGYFFFDDEQFNSLVSKYV